MSDSTVISVNNLVKKYGSFAALNGISFEVSEGEVFGLLGENGAGKTTTLEIIEGLRPATSGDVTVFGMDNRKNIDHIKQRIGVQLQASAYFTNLTLYEILDLFGSFYEKRRDPDELLDIVKLSSKANNKVGELSGGQAQRFSLVASLVNNPELVFFDEPTTGLDPLARQNVWDLVKEVQSAGKTVILTSHYLEEVESLCGRVGIMKQGALVALDSVTNLIMGIDDPIRVDFAPVDKLTDAQRQALEASGRLEDSRAKAGELTLYIKNEDALKAALREMERVDTERMTVTTANLEDVFVKLTGGTIQVGAEG